jgi:hypothetical protein
VIFSNQLPRPDLISEQTLPVMLHANLRMRSLQTALRDCGGQSSRASASTLWRRGGSPPSFLRRRERAQAGRRLAGQERPVPPRVLAADARIVNAEYKGMEFSMRDSICFVALGAALAAGTSVAQAQTVETIVTPAPGPAVVAQAPVAVPPSGVLLPPASTVAVTAPVETVETVRTVTTTEPRRVHRGIVRARPVQRVTTTTRTVTVRQGVAATAPAYDELTRSPRLYDVVTPAPVVAPAVAPAVAAQPVVTTTAAAPVAMPTYRYIYEPGRILVVDPYTNIAVQAIPR